MKKGCKIFLVIAIIFFVLSICAVGGYFTFRNFEAESVPLTYSFETGASTLDAIESVGIEGTTIVSEDGSTSIYLPPGSIDIGEHFSIWHQPILSSDIPEYAKVHGDMIVLERDQPVEFLKPVAVTVPIDKTTVGPDEIVAVYQYHPEEGIIEATTLIDYNYEAGYVTFATTHFSSYVRISVAEEKLKDALENGFDTGFKPSEYGWYIRNWGSFETVGNCMGMSAVSKWYYNYKDKIGDSKLYDRYQEGILDQEFDDVVAHELAGRVDVMLEPRFHEFKDDMAALGYDYDGIRNLYPKLIMQNMVLTGQPEMLYIRKTKTLGLTEGTTSFEPKVNHAVLAYKYKDGKLYLYDPNFPYRSGGDANQNERSVNFSYERGFGVYHSGLTSGDSKYQFNAFIPFSSNFVIGNKKVQQLMSMSTQRFPDDYYPEITITSTEILPVGDLRINGIVTGERYAKSTYPKFIHAYLNNYTIDQNHPRAEVASDGTFSIDVETKGDQYVIHLLAADKTGTLSWSAYKMFTGELPTVETPEENQDGFTTLCDDYAPYNVPDGWLDKWACDEYDYYQRTLCANPGMDEEQKQKIIEEMNYYQDICGLEK